MHLTKRLTWLLVLVFVAIVAISSVLSLNEHEQKESFVADEYFEDGFDFDDYDGEEGEYEGPKQEYAAQLLPGTYSHTMLPQQQQQHQANYAAQPVSYEQAPHQYAQPPPPPPPPPMQSYQPVPLPVYTVPAVIYKQPQMYVEPPQPVAELYQQPQQPAVYQQPQPVVNYTVVEQYPQQKQVYQPPQQPQVMNYTAPVAVKYQQQPQVVYRPQQVNYTAPAVAVKQSYAQPMAVKQVANYSVSQYKLQQSYSASSLAQKYTLTELAPYTTPYGYHGNHQSLHYYRFLRSSTCPKLGYGSHGLASYKDIEGAFAFALTQLGYLQHGHIQYMNMSTPSFAARHQISSYLSQKNARMDEEGLLVEFVSLYLADRLCMSKWERQRYLPPITKLVSSGHFPNSHACSQLYSAGHKHDWQPQNCYAQKYRTFDGFCNNPHHPYWGKSNVCHIRFLSPDYADGIQSPRESHNYKYSLPNPRLVANTIHSDVPLEGPYNLMKMQWGQFINHDISSTALSSYDGLIDCCRQPHTRGCWPIMVPLGDRFYGPLNVTCLNFIRSGVCPTCQLGPRQQTNKNTAYLDCSHVYGNNAEQARQLRAFVGGLLRTSSGKMGEQLLPIASGQEQCVGTCYQAGDSRVNQHPALTVLHVLLLRNHNRHAQALARRHPNWNDETLYQEARRLNIAEYQMITYAEYFPIVFGPVLSAYYHLTPLQSGYTQWDAKVDPSTWNEYTTATCRFGHSQIASTFGLYSRIHAYGQQQHQNQPSFRLKEWFFRPTMLADGMVPQLVNGLVAKPSLSVDPWVTNDVRNHLYQSPKEHHGGDLAATNIWRGRDHGLPGYVHYVEYCFNYKVRGWKDLDLFIPRYTLLQLRKLYKVVENIDLFTGGLAERHFPGADTGPTFACVNGIQYHHLKFGDRYYFEHGNQAGSFTPAQLDEIKRSSLARLLCRTAHLPNAPQFAFLQPSMYNPLVNCSQVGDIDYNKF